MNTPHKKEPLHDCSGCTDRFNEGTHQFHTTQHPCPEKGDINCGYCYPNSSHKKECCKSCKGFDHSKFWPSGAECECHVPPGLGVGHASTPPQEKGEDFEARFPFYEGTVSSQAIKSFIQDQITATEERVREEILKDLEEDAFCPDRLSKCDCTDEHELQNRIRSLINNK